MDLKQTYKSSQGNNLTQIKLTKKRSQPIKTLIHLKEKEVSSSFFSFTHGMLQTVLQIGEVEGVWGVQTLQIEFNA